MRARRIDAADEPRRAGNETNGDAEVGSPTPAAAANLNAAQAAARAALQDDNPRDADEDGASLGSDAMAGGEVDWDEEPRLDVKASVMSGGRTPMLIGPPSPVIGVVGLSHLAHQHHEVLCGRLNQQCDLICGLQDTVSRLVAGQAEGTRVLGAMHRVQEEWTRRSITRIDNALAGNSQLHLRVRNLERVLDGKLVPGSCRHRRGRRLAPAIRRAASVRVFQ